MFPPPVCLFYNTPLAFHVIFSSFPKKPKSVQLYNQIGNFWRIKGDAAKAIECFRRALAVSPHNSEVLLNLARVLFTLQYLDDAIFLTRRSLEVQAPDKGAWQHYFTLGEIFKAYGHYQEATAHLKHTLELKPGFEPAEIALKEMETMPAGTIHIYTLVIIVFLVSIQKIFVCLTAVKMLPHDWCKNYEMSLCLHDNCLLIGTKCRCQVNNCKR